MAKLTKQVQKLLEQQKEAVENYSFVLKMFVTGKEENLVSWYRERGQAYYEGMLQATYCTIESILHTANCYEVYSFDVELSKLTKFNTDLFRKYY